jgi:hypothetical protein
MDTSAGCWKNGIELRLGWRLVCKRLELLHVFTIRCVRNNTPGEIVRVMF